MASGAGKILRSEHNEPHSWLNAIHLLTLIKSKKMDVLAKDF